MTAPLFDMVKMGVVGTPGTGVVTLGAALAGFQTFAQAGAHDGDTVSCGFGDAGNVWEVGHAVYHSAGPTLTRTPLFSSNGTSAVSLTSTAQVWCAMLAEDVGGGGGGGSGVSSFNTRTGAVTLTAADLAALDFSTLSVVYPGNNTTVWINGNGAASGPLWVGPA